MRFAESFTITEQKTDQHVKSIFPDLQGKLSYFYQISSEKTVSCNIKSHMALVKNSILNDYPLKRHFYQCSGTMCERLMAETGWLLHSYVTGGRRLSSSIKEKENRVGRYLFFHCKQLSDHLQNSGCSSRSSLSGDSAFQDSEKYCAVAVSILRSTRHVRYFERIETWHLGKP